MSKLDAGQIPIKYLTKVWLGGAKPPGGRLSVELSDILSVPDLNVAQVGRVDVATGVLTHGNAFTSENGWMIFFGGGAIEVQRQPTSLDLSEMGDLESFTSAASKCLAAAFEGRLASRISLVVERLEREMTEEEMMQAADRMLSGPEDLRKNPFEWDWRSARKVPRDFGKVNNEATTTIVTLRRSSGRVGELAFDRLGTVLDINTFHANTDERFDAADAQDFLERCVGWFNALRDELDGYLWGGK